MDHTLNVTFVTRNVLNVSVAPSIVKFVLKEELLKSQTVLVNKDSLMSTVIAYLVITDVTIVKTLKDTVAHVKITELKLQPVSVQKELMKLTDNLSVQFVVNFVKLVLKMPTTVLNVLKVMLTHQIVTLLHKILLPSMLVISQLDLSELSLVLTVVLLAHKMLLIVKFVDQTE
jgi:hypothetical protein